MKLDKKEMMGLQTVGWMVGAGLLAYGLYQLLKGNDGGQRVDLEPATMPPDPHPYFDPHPHRQPEESVLKPHLGVPLHHAGNLPGERNRIGGRASGKKARY